MRRQVVRDRFFVRVSARPRQGSTVADRTTRLKASPKSNHLLRAEGVKTGSMSNSEMPTKIK